jgi:6-phosphofructokinase 1
LLIFHLIGGDGTHRGAYKISQECIARGLNVAIVGIPKTIDNDIDLIDRSFGFTTSVEAAQAAIVSAKTEAKCNMPNGIGIVKLMGRSAGFIATHATLASGETISSSHTEHPDLSAEANYYCHEHTSVNPIVKH